MAAAEDQRPAVERVRRDEGDGDGIDAPLDDRAARREVVAGRAGRGGDEDAIAAALAEVDTVDGPLEDGHAAELIGRHEDVVDGDEATIRRLD